MSMPWYYVDSCDSGKSARRFTPDFSNDRGGEPLQKVLEYLKDSSLSMDAIWL